MTRSLTERVTNLKETIYIVNEMTTEKTKWKSDKKLPRILKINRIKDLTISVLFSDGHNRVLDFEAIFSAWKITKKRPEYKLMSPAEFKKVKLENYTLVWPNAKSEFRNFDGKKITPPYSIGADTLYELSEPDKAREGLPVGALIKKARIKAGLTQEELGARIGSDKHYISKVEANQFQVEISTLRKIIEGGLHRRMEIIIK